MTDITLISINWNQQKAMELMLASFRKHHSDLIPTLIVDNGSTDGSKEWLIGTQTPFLSLPSNIGHEQAVNLIYPLIQTKYALIVDTDIEFLSNVFEAYIPLLNDEVKAVGDFISGDSLGSPIKPRIGAWFFLFDIQAMRDRGVNEFRDKWNSNWSYDVGSWQTEKILEAGFKIHHTPRLNSDIDGDLLGMQYGTHIHFGKVSWNLENHGDRKSEVEARRKYIEERVKYYE